MDEFNTDIVCKTLTKVVGILELHNIKYRFLGSVVITAINGKLHRSLGDLDLIIDSNKKDVLYAALKNLGYKRAGGIFNFARKYLSLEQLEHTKLLGLGYFYGIWKNDGTFIMGDKNLSLNIDPHVLKETKYVFCGVNFLGILENAIAAGIYESRTNPKRKQELLILKDKKIEPFANKYIHINIFGIRADWIYHLSMTVLNIIGVIRVRLGLSFDPWR